MVIVLLGVIEIEIEEVLLATLGCLLCFNSRNVSSNSVEHVFFDLLIPKVKPILIGVFYRPPNVNTFLETFFNDLKHIDLHKSEVYFRGDFNVSLLLNDKFILIEN